MLSLLDREFDADALAGLREAVLGCATACGMPGDRAVDVMLAVHELAANAVVTARDTGGCGYISPPAPCTARSATLDLPAATPASPGKPPGALAAMPWPVEQGHGLWVVHGAADHVRMTSGPHGSLITAAFTLPAAARA